MGARHVAAVRRFNRFYTRKIGVLGRGLLGSAFSLTEVRVLYEVAHRAAPTAGAIGHDLGVDAGYLSRMLASFERQGLVRARRSAADRRRRALALTGRGRAAFRPLEARQEREVASMLAPLDQRDRRRLVAAMATIGQLLGARQAGDPAFRLRPPRAGDLGWVVQRHGAIYAEEYGYDATFEALVARIAADFVDRFDAAGERCWIAERGGEPVGSVFLVRKSRTVAKLRLLLVEPHARGQGIGARLIDECVRFAKACGYRKLTLWTQSELDAARHLYERAGFRCVAKHRHDSFGKRGLVAETWDLALNDGSAVGR